MSGTHCLWLKECEWAIAEEKLNIKKAVKKSVWLLKSRLLIKHLEIYSLVFQSYFLFCCHYYVLTQQKASSDSLTFER